MSFSNYFALLSDREPDGSTHFSRMSTQFQQHSVTQLPNNYQQQNRQQHSHDDESSRHHNNDSHHLYEQQQQQHRHSNRRRTRQQRAARWEDSQAARSFSDQYKQFDRGSDKYRKASEPSISELIDYVNKENTRATTKGDKSQLKATALEIATHERLAKLKVDEQVKTFWTNGKYGHAPKEKDDDVIRIYFENFNSLSLFNTGKSRGKKIRRLNQLLKEYRTDCLAGVELRTDWRFVDHSEKFDELFGKGSQTRGLASNNIAGEKLNRDQHGGTGILALDRFASFVQEVGCDQTGLGRWSWIKVGGGGKHTKIFSLYQPCDPGPKTKGLTVWDQHRRHFEKKGDGRSPRTILFEDIIIELLKCKQAGEEIVLFGDFNEHVYNGRFSKRLAMDDLRMTEQCLTTNKMPLPSTSPTGTRPIDACFATSGVDCVNACLLPRMAGVGDHRAMILDFTSESLIGSVFPNVIKASSRKLHCDSDRLRNNYNTVLRQLCDRHQMFRKLAQIRMIEDELSVGDFLLLMNKWDGELESYMKAAEKRCNSFKQCHIEWSPEVGLWLSRRWLLQRVQKYLKGKVKDPRNLFRDCRKHGLKDPRAITQRELDFEVWICTHELSRLAKQAPHLRRQHLKQLIREAKGCGDHDRATQILKILKREAVRKRWKRIGRSTKKPHGRSVLSVKVPDMEGEGYEEFHTEGEVFEQVSKNLSSRFRLAFSAPAYKGTLFDDIGFLGDTVAAQDILEGNYVFPHDCDPATRLLFEEAAHTYASMSKDEIASYVTVDDFQYYWQRVNERISSSYSGLHFSHYKAASFDRELSILHAAKLSACARKGVPLARWGRGLTVLLEKICGNNYVHKLRAICLFEADFNWWNKLVFARRMMKNAADNGAIPNEVFAVKGSHSNNATMSKTFFCDTSKVLHHPAAVGEADFSDCYDRTAHGPKSIALQAWGVSKSSVSVLLTALQTMKFFLRTGFGESSESYGGSEENRLAGSGQGNGAASSAFSAISSLIVNAYRRMGHGAKLTSCYTSRLFLLAAIMYVDDTDLLHWAPSRTMRDSELIEYVQSAQNDYGNLSQATGGACKQEKCSMYFLCYEFVRGTARLKPLKRLPPAHDEVILKNGTSAPSHITIPQPDGSSLPIQTHDISDASKMLGVHFAPDGDGTTHIEQMKQKGLDWLEGISTRPLPRSDAWLSFYLQLLPGMTWGLVSVILPPRKLESMIQALYYKLLPFLGVNRNITKEFRMLPEMYHGLGMPNFVVLAFAEKVYFLQCHWNLSGSAGSMMTIAYEAFLIETGLYGNIFTQDFSTFESLATPNTWFHNFWELADYLDIQVELSGDFHLQPVREFDAALMHLFAAAGFTKEQLHRLNIVRKYKCVVHLSDILCCDGKTVDGTILGRGRRTSIAHDFPLEKPTNSDYVLWDSAIAAITSSSYQSPNRLGRYIKTPHLEMIWGTSEDEQFVYRSRIRDLEEMHDVFVLDSERRVTRFGRRYFWSHTCLGTAPSTRYASIKFHRDLTVSLHSTASIPRPLPVPTDFWTVLHSFDNQTFWDSFVCDGDGSWIHHGLLMGSLVIVHDGSYMPHLTTSVCSAAVMIYCKVSRQRAKGAIAEFSDAADNYRAEILGGVMCQLILRAASRRASSPYLPVDIDCDNLGVVNHGNSPHRQLPAKQSQADALRSFKQLIIENPFPSHYRWVEGHSVEHKGWQNCNINERINDKVDKMAKYKLLAAYSNDDYISSNLPFEQVRVMIDGDKVTGSFKTSFATHWGATTARNFFHEKKILDKCNFKLVWWKGIDRAMKDFPKTYRLWLTKHVSEFCGSNQQLAYWQPDQSPLCPCCGMAAEYTMHITRCSNPGRREMLRLTVHQLSAWLGETMAEPDMIDMIENYLLAQGTKTMRECLTIPSTDLELLATSQDKLGWDSFLEGRISKLFLQVMKPLLLDSRRYLSPERWGQQFIGKLLNITHKQWIFRNSRLHFRKLDGLTSREHEKIFERMRTLMWTDPEELLPCHRHYLEEDFGALGEGPAISRQVWIASMDSALSAAKEVNSGRMARGCYGHFFTPRPRNRRCLPTVRHNGSVLYRQSRRNTTNQRARAQHIDERPFLDQA